MKPRGFTLVELLVVVVIVLILAVLVAKAISPSDSSRLRESARIGQAALLGARDRALHAKAPRGIRLIVSESDQSIATGFVYVQPIEPQTYSGVMLQGTLTIAHSGSDWLDLQSQGFLPAPFRVKIGDRWHVGYAVTDAGNGIETIDLTVPPTVPDPALPFAVEVQPRNELIPHHEPISLPSGVIIDLALTPFSGDLLFSPRGSVTGGVAALGPIHLAIRDIRDASRNPIDPANVAEVVLLTIFPQTGHVATFPIDPTDSDNDGFADDPYRFAKAGAGL